MLNTDIIRLATQMFDLNNQVEREIAADWATQQHNNSGDIAAEIMGATLRNGCCSHRPGRIRHAYRFYLWRRLGSTICGYGEGTGGGSGDGDGHGQGRMQGAGNNTGNGHGWGRTPGSMPDFETVTNDKEVVFRITNDIQQCEELPIKIGSFVICHSNGSGIYFGRLRSHDGVIVELSDASIIHRWFGFNDLFTIAFVGLDDKRVCISTKVSEVLILDVQVMIACTQAATESLSRPRWSND